MARRRTGCARARARATPGRRIEDRLGRLCADRTDLRQPRICARPRTDRRLVSLDHDRHLCDHRRMLIYIPRPLGADAGRPDRGFALIAAAAVRHGLYRHVRGRGYPVRLEPDHPPTYADELSVHGDAVRACDDAGRLGDASVDADYGAADPPNGAEILDRSEE